MAGLTVPNASDYGVTIQSIDQAEPDSLDFQILGNHNYGVLSGCNITVYSSGNGSADLTAGEVFVNSEYGSVAAGSLSFTAAAADPRFDIIVVEKSGSTFIFNTVVGTADATNPVFPAIASNQVPLYALYRKSGVTFNSQSVIDKRLFLNISHRTGTAVPTLTADAGDIYVRTGATLDVNQSSMYVYVDGSWQNIAKYYPIDEGLSPFLLAGL